MWRPHWTARDPAPEPIRDPVLAKLVEFVEPIANWDVPEREIKPMQQGPVEEAAAGMATLEGHDFAQMTEDERQPWRESAMKKLADQHKRRQERENRQLIKEEAGN